MPFISYAQNLEDVMLWRALGDYSPGFYIDIGAHDPIIDSVTKAFYEAGWLGINVEPLQNCFEKISIDRPRDINLNIAVDSSNGKKEFYAIGDEIGLSTLVAEYAEKYAATTEFKVKKSTVETRTLADICHNFVEKGQDIHFLKIDIEGSEKAVLDGADFKNYRPWIIVIEATEPGTTIPSFLDWEPLLINAEYTFIYFDGLNRFYIANEKLDTLRHHFLSPPNIWDEYTAYNTVVALTDIADQLTDTKNQLADTENKLADTKNQLADTKNQLADTENKLADTENQLADTKNQLADTENKLADTENQLLSLLRSRSWQWTKPVRKILSHARAIKNKLPKKYEDIPIKTDWNKEVYNRIAVISSPRSGNHWIRSVLTDALNMPSIAVHNYKDIEEPLPERCFLQLHWYKEPNFQMWLKEHNFKTLCIARNPLDIFLSVLHFIRHDSSTRQWLGGNAAIPPGLAHASPSSKVFLDYCLSAGAEHLLSISYQWWQDESTFKLRYEDCVANPAAILGNQIKLLGGEPSAIDLYLERSSLQKMQALPNRHGWQGRPGLYKKLIPPKYALKIYIKHRKVFEQFGYTLRPYFLSYRQACKNWEELLRP